jgi:PIN domain nuclease of toxin-antitoxin system
LIASQPILLLDTCAIIFLAGNVRLKPEAGRAIDRAADQKKLYVSPMSAWEIGMAVARNRINTTLSAIDYFNTFMELTGAQLCGTEPSVLIAASLLPGRLHRDPVDRILISTARFNNHTLVTSDRAILAYGNEGHVKVFEC